MMVVIVRPVAVLAAGRRHGLPFIPYGGIVQAMDAKLKKSQLARLGRIEGQVRGVARMIEEDRYCIDVLTQISAIQAALDKVALGLLDGHARHCLMGDGDGPSGEDAAEELMGAVGRLMRRG